MAEALDALDAVLDKSPADAETFDALAAALAICDTALPAPTLDRLLSSLRQGFRNGHAAVAISALACVPVLCPLLATVPLGGETKSSQLRQALLAWTAQGGLFDRLGDKDRVREAAAAALLATGRACVVGSQNTTESESPLVLLDKAVKEIGLASKAARVRESTLHYLVQLRAEYPQLPLRPYVGPLVTALEDSDQHVRDAARESVIAIFGNPAVSSAARSDLKTQLAKHSVRKATVDVVLARVLGRQESLSDNTSSSSRAGTPDPSHRNRASMTRPSMREPTSRTVSVASSSAVTLASAASTADVAPVYVASVRDLEKEFASMAPPFVGKETEHNWQGRDKNVARIRGMLLGEAHLEYHDAFMIGLRSVLDGLVRTLASLRTTLATATCNLMDELATSLGHALDPLLDPILPALLKMAAQTKKIVVSASQSAAARTITALSYHPKMLTMLEAMTAEKTALARTAAIDHLRTFVNAHAQASRAAIEAGHGLDLLERGIARALVDATPAVRETARPTFWAAHAVFPQRFDRVMASLEGPARTQLERANGAAPASATTSPSKPRPSVRAMISAKRTSSASSSSMPPPAIPVPSARAPAPTVSAVRARPPSIYARPSASAVETGETAPAARPRVASSNFRSSSAYTPRSSPARTARPPVASTPPAPPSLPAEALQESFRTLELASGVPLPMPDADDDLMHYEAPFRPGRRSIANGSATRTPQSARKTSRPVAAGTPSSTSGRSGRDDPVASMLDHAGDEGMVEDAIRDQAEQAEQTAARLLELTLEEEARTPITPRAGATMIKPTAIPAAAATSKFSSTVFQDSPAASGKERPASILLRPGQSWWLQHAALMTASAAASGSPPEDVERLVRALDAGEANAVQMRSLAGVSAAHPLREASTNGVSNGHADHSTFWAESRRFERVFEGALELLRRPALEPKELADASLVLLKELVQHQTPLLSGHELPLFDLFLDMRMSGSKQVCAAVDAIAGLLCDVIEPLYGLRCLRSSLQSVLDRENVDGGARARAHALGCRCIGQLFHRLPAEVLEEEVPLTSIILLGAFNAQQADLRQATVAALVSALGVLGDETQLFTLLPGLQPAQKALLTYYNNAQSKA